MGQRAAAVTGSEPTAAPRGLLGRWRYRESGRRDVRLDLLRGYAVFAMICDHVSNTSWFSPFTGGNRFMASAAEAFVFLAGLVMGMVYGRRMQRDGWLHGAEAILRRAATLYVATVGLTLVFVALFQFTDLRLWLDRSYGLGLDQPVELVVSTLTLHYTYHGTDILWMYTILIAAAPLVLRLLCYGHVGPVLAGSWLLWLAYQQFPNESTPWTATNVNYFPVSAWQVLFVNGLVIGYHRDEVGRVLGRVPAWAFLIGFGIGMAGLIAIHRAYDTGRLAGWPLLGQLAGETYWDVFDKTTVPISRIGAFVIVAGFAYSLVTVFWTPIRRALGWLLLPLGENSLRAYCSHLLLIVLVYNIDVLARLYDQSRAANTILQGITVAMTYGIVVGWKRLEHGVAWRPSMPAWPEVLQPQRHPLIAGASALLLMVTVGGALLAGPARGSRQADLATAAAEAGVLRYVPTEATAQGPLPVLLALHGDGQTGPEFAIPLVDIARANGWALIAPTIEYADRNDPRQIAAVINETLPGIRGLVESLDDAEGVPLQPRVLVLGGGRGASTARLFGLFYPRMVAAVASAGDAPCILPATKLDGEPLPVPFGLDDLEQYTRAELDREALRQTAFWIGIRPSAGESPDGCAWGALADSGPAERAQIFADLLREIGTEVEIATLGEISPDQPIDAQALQFLRTHQPRAERQALASE